MSDEQIQELIKRGEISDIVAAEDNKRGCPETRWDGPYVFRCSLGIYKCAIHGQFPVTLAIRY